MEIKINKKNNKVCMGDNLYYLSKNEIALLEVLYSNPDVIFSSEELREKCWPGRVVSYNSVPVAIKHIRDVFKKNNNGIIDVVLTIKGEGYQFCGSDLVICFESNNGSVSTQEERGGWMILLYLVVCPLFMLLVILLSVCSIFL
ncbi:hypothetical protein I6P91_004615 [Salmonella enterica]|nr:hypothetical protein [Salmonella enterica]ECS6156336.1 hypothetical protein [Salmonella enterica subsp. enterica serovar Javiana]EBR7649368.1 hypothetical protein [Salmonella enterica]EDQ6154866.1 hypothetical protein [Salmonella enterica subsp. enterica serovar Javiana]EEC5487967.1 hypothetical protein [Salmonella enterica]